MYRFYLKFIKKSLIEFFIGKSTSIMFTLRIPTLPAALQLLLQVCGLWTEGAGIA
jgi:hypothetical protein